MKILKEDNGIFLISEYPLTFAECVEDDNQIYLSQ